MRVLHTRPTHDGYRPAQHHSPARRGAGAAGPRGESLPLRELSCHRRGRRCRRRPARGGGMSTAVQPLTTIGHVTPRVDAIERVTGQAKYTNDLKLPGMLYARVLRSPHPHARIRHIDTSAASRLPGVQAVITHENAQVVWGAGAVAGGRQYSDAIKEITRQRRYIFNNPVR